MSLKSESGDTASAWDIPRVPTATTPTRIALGELLHLPASVTRWRHASRLRAMLRPQQPPKRVSRWSIRASTGTAAARKMKKEGVKYREKSKGTWQPRHKNVVLDQIIKDPYSNETITYLWPHSIDSQQLDHIMTQANSYMGKIKH